MFSTVLLWCESRLLPKQETVPRFLARGLIMGDRNNHSPPPAAATTGQRSSRHDTRTRAYRPPLSSSYYKSSHFQFNSSNSTSSCWRMQHHSQPQFHRPYYPYHYRQHHHHWRPPPVILHHDSVSNGHSYHRQRTQHMHFHRGHCRFGGANDRQSSPSNHGARIFELGPKRPKVRVSDCRRDSENVKYPFVSLVSYNLLAQDLIDKNMFLYRTDRLEYLQWEHRKKQLLKELLETRADIYCFQEVQEDHYFNWYCPELKANGYEGLYQKRTGHYTDGCAVFYLSHKLQVLEHKKVLYQKQQGTLVRDNVAILAKFMLSPFHYPSAVTRTFCIATTHLLFNHKAGEIKLAQICYLMAELHSMAREGNDSLLPSVICGDFNCLPNSPMLDFLLNSRLDYSKLDAWDVGGYKNQPVRHRPIPVPLFPKDIGITQDCRYKEPHTITPSISTDSKTMEVCSSCSKDVQEGTKQDMSENHNNKSECGGGKFGGNSDCPPRPPAAATCSTIEPATHPILTHPFKLQSGYPIPRDKDHTPTVTTYHRSACETVDYVLFTPPTSEKTPGFQLVSRTALPSQHTLRQHGPQPNHAFSSDHLYLQVDLQLIN